VIPVNESKLVIGGGFNNNSGNSDKVYTVDTNTGYVNYLPSLTNPGWTVLSPVYLNGVLNIFSCGEESDNNMPDHITYKLNVPI
jgi:hypothetical protein